MPDFAAQLIETFAHREAAAREAACRREERLGAAIAQIEAGDAAAQALLADVIAPLVAAFQTALESRGVLREGLVVAEAAPHGLFSDAARPAGRKKRPTTGDFKRFLVSRAEAGLPPLPADAAAQIAAFDAHLAAAREEAARAAALPAWRRLAYRARGSAAVRYEIRLTAAASRVSSAGCGGCGAVNLSAELLHGTTADFRRDAAPALIQLPSTRLPTDVEASHAAARAWCENVLQQCAAALHEVNHQPVSSPRAPLCAPLVAAPLFGEAMSFEL